MFTRCIVGLWLLSRLAALGLSIAGGILTISSERLTPFIWGLLFGAVLSLALSVVFRMMLLPQDPVRHPRRSRKVGNRFQRLPRTGGGKG